MDHPRRGLLDATLPVALAAATLDAVLASSRDTAVVASVGPVTLLGASALFVLAVGLARGLAATIWRHTTGAPRAALATAVFAGLGGLAGLALFSGTGIRRLGLQRPLIALAVLVAAVVGFVVARRDLRLRAPAWLLTLAALALYAAHATVLVRQYELLHALLAVLVAGLWCDAASGSAASRPSPSARWLRGAFLAIALWTTFALVRSNVARSAVRRVAPLGQYVARAVGALVARETPVETAPRVRRVDGPSLPMTEGDVVLVTVDALRADQLRALGGRGRMPHLDALAARGLLFRRAYAATPHTSYSLASLMTGTYARAAMALGSQFPRATTLAGRLRAAGFVTAGWYPPAVFAVDGDRFAALASRHWDLEHADEAWDDAATRVQKALQWARTVRRDRRAFAWVHLFEPHEPYVLHPEHPYGTDARARYDAECSAVDDALATLIASWGRPATWIVTADHGEEFGEHGGSFHGTSLYDEQSRVPLVVVVDGVAPRAVSSPVSLVDVMPTIVAGVGAVLPPGTEGTDLGVFARALTAPTMAFAETGDLRMVVADDEKLIVDHADATLQRYDLTRDPSERRNLADEAPDRTRALAALIQRWQASHAEAAAARSRGVEAVIPAALARALQGDRGAAPDVVALLPATDDETAARAARVLGDLGDRSGPVRDALAGLLGRSSPLAEEAAISLVRLGDERGRALATQVLQTRANESRRRRAALGLAAWRVPAAAPVLDAWAVDPRASDVERDRAIALLVELHSPASRATWETLLESARLAPIAATALGTLDDPVTIPALRATLDRWHYPATQRAVVDALLSLGDPEAIPRLSVALGANDPLDRVGELLARAQEPGTAIAGWRGATRHFERRGRYPLRARTPASAQRLYVQLNAADTGTVTLDGFDPAPVHRGAQQLVFTWDDPRPLRVVSLRASVGVSVVMIAAVATRPPAPP